MDWRCWICTKECDEESKQIGIQRICTSCLKRLKEILDTV